MKSARCRAAGRASLAAGPIRLLVVGSPRRGIERARAAAALLLSVAAAGGSPVGRAPYRDIACCYARAGIAVGTPFIEDMARYGRGRRGLPRRRDAVASRRRRRRSSSRCRGDRRRADGNARLLVDAGAAIMLAQRDSRRSGWRWLATRAEALPAMARAGSHALMRPNGS
jgi:hypothetical protein